MTTCTRYSRTLLGTQISVLNTEAYYRGGGGVGIEYWTGTRIHLRGNQLTRT